MQTIQELINAIAWDRRILPIPRHVKSPQRAVVIKDPSIDQRNHADFIKKETLRYALEDGVPSEADVLQSAIEGGIWSEEQSQKLEAAEEEISKKEAEIAVTNHPVAKRFMVQQVATMKSEMLALEAMHNQFAYQTAEYMAQLEHVYSLMRHTVFTIDDQPLWKSDEEFINHKETFPEFFAIVATNIASDGLMSTADLRSVARSGEWRIFWTQCREDIRSLFNKTAVELNMNQKSLVYWSKIYDIAFEAYEDKPSEEVIADDKLFDDWLHRHLSERSKENKDKPTQHAPKANDHQEQGLIIEGYYIEQCNCGVGNKPAKGLGLKRRHADSCTYGRFVEYTQEEKDRIADETFTRNPGVIRAVMGREQKAITEKGLVDERNLRNKNTRKVLGMDSKITSRK